jgi:hypothetical protein
LGIAFIGYRQQPNACMNMVSEEVMHKKEKNHKIEHFQVVVHTKGKKSTALTGAMPFRRPYDMA